MTIKRNQLIDICILLLIFFQLVFLEFFGLGRLLNKVVLLAIIFRLFLRKRNGKGSVVEPTLLALLFFFLFGSLMAEQFNLQVVKTNFMFQLYPLVYAYYIYDLAMWDADVLDECMNKGFWIFNGAACVNILALFVQILKPYTINAVHTSAAIEYYPDTISGLFAYCSTHALCLFSCFIIIYNLQYVKKIKNTSGRYCMAAYIAFLLLSFSYISLKNDNKAFFVLFPLFFVLYFLKNHRMKILTRTKWMRYIAWIVPVLVVLCLVFSDAVVQVVETSIGKIIDNVVRAVNIGNNASGSGERIAIVITALSQPSTWLLGVGFGTASMYASSFWGFKHFGQADFGSLLVFGGIWFAVLQIVLFTKMFSCITAKQKNNRLFTAAIILILLFVSIYTQCYTKTNIMTALLLNMLALRLVSERGNQTEQ